MTVAINESYQEQDYEFKIWLGSINKTETKANTNATGRYFVLSKTDKVSLEGQSVAPPLAPAKIDLRLQPMPIQIDAITTNKTSKETPDYEIARTTLMKLPIPEWVLGLPAGYELSYTCELLINDAQWANLKVQDPGAWSLTVDVGRLFKKFLAPKAQYFAGITQQTWTSPSRWVLQFIGVLAAKAVRGKYVTLTCGWKSSQYISDYLDLRVLEDIEAKGMEIMPYYKDSPVASEEQELPHLQRRPSDSSDDLGDWDLLRPESA